MLGDQRLPEYIEWAMALGHDNVADLIFPCLQTNYKCLDELLRILWYCILYVHTIPWYPQIAIACVDHA